jgi:hypothetical protein
MYFCSVKQINSEMSLSNWIRPRRRLWAIYNELGYIPWRKPPGRKVRRRRRGVYIGTREAIPFMNDDAKRTFAHLLLRPGYMMRDYILRGQHERYLAPFTALLVFYSVFTLIVAVVKPGQGDSFGDGLLRGFEDVTIMDEQTAAMVNDSTAMDDGDTLSVELFDRDITLDKQKVRKATESILLTMRDAVVLTRLDMHPEAADTPWKKSLAAIEGDLRSKGIPLFLGNFLLLWMSMTILLRRRGISMSGAAAASGYVLCQYCIFMFLELLLSFGRSTELGLLLLAVLLFIDYRQLLGIASRQAFRLTVRTGLWYLFFFILFYALLSGGIILFALSRV